MSPTPHSYVETDPVKCALADKLIAESLDEGNYDYDIDDAEFGQAGRKALANRFLIAIINYPDQGQDQFYVTGTQADAWRYDGTFTLDPYTLLGMTLPDEFTEVQEVLWQLYDEKPLDELAALLRDAGFQFDRAFQDKEGDPTLTDQLAKIFAPSSAEFNAHAQKKDETPSPQAPAKKNDSGFKGPGG